MRTLERLRSSWWILLALAPFAIFFVLFQAIPIVVLLLGSIGGLDSITPKYLVQVFTPSTASR